MRRRGRDRVIKNEELRMKNEELEKNSEFGIQR
jgi:hypothetical protein